MKRFFYLSLFSLLFAAPGLRAQDSAYRQEAEENYKILKARIEELTETKADQAKRIQSLEKQISELRTQVSKPTGNYATQEEVKRLAETVQEIDKKREADKELILKEIGKLAKVISAPGPRTRDTKEKEKPVVDPVPPVNPDQPTFSYTVKQGDYLSTIVQAYKEKGVVVTVDQILKINPGLKATALYPGKKILIPDTRSAGAKSDAK
jgi:LysM repeat protein